MIYEGVIRTRKQSSAWSYTVSRFARILSAGLVHTHTHPFNGPFSRTTRVSRYQKGKTNLDFTEARDSEWQWHQLGHMQVCTSLQTDNHASTPPLIFTGRMSFLPPNQQRQSTEGVYLLIIFNIGNSVTQKILYQQVSNIAKNITLLCPVDTILGNYTVKTKIDQIAYFCATLYYRVC